jgi:hypothetical protein
MSYKSTKNVLPSGEICFLPPYRSWINSASSSTKWSEVNFTQYVVLPAPFAPNNIILYSSGCSIYELRCCCQKFTAEIDGSNLLLQNKYSFSALLYAPAFNLSSSITCSESTIAFLQLTRCLKLNPDQVRSLRFYSLPMTYHSKCSSQHTVFAKYFNPLSVH